MSSDDFIVKGDLNAKLDVESSGQLYNDSPNGRLLLNVVYDQSLVVVNFSNKCSGTWTHVIRTTGRMSRLDYALTSTDFNKNIINMTIDETCLV